jgi:hypothetical protein
MTRENTVPNLGHKVQKPPDFAERKQTTEKGGSSTKLNFSILIAAIAVVFKRC